MSKRILISLMGIILIASIALTGYKIFEPKSNAEVKEDVSIYLTLSSVKDFTLSNGNNVTFHYFFCYKEDENCKYIYDSVFPSIKSENNGIDVKTIIDYVDISEEIQLKKDFINKLKEWGISKYPALVSCRVENNQIIINNVLEYNENDPLNKDDIINWMKENNIYSGIKK